MTDKFKLRLYATEPQSTDPYDNVKFDFGEIGGVVGKISPKVRQTAVIIYGFDQALCMDTGVVKSYSISFNRVNPMNPDNSSTTDTARWTNAKWLTAIHSFLSRWQAKSNGFTVQMDSNFKDCFPDITENVYVSSISLPKSNASSQNISGSIQLKVGTLKVMDKPPSLQVTLTYNPQVSSLTPFYDVSTKGVPMSVSYPPTAWLEAQHQASKVFTGWAESAGTTSVRYRPEQQITLESDDTLYAVWRDAKPLVVFTASGSHTYTVSADTHRIIVYCIGGGGGGGGGGIYKPPTTLEGGAGGGGGGVIAREYPVQPNDTFSLHVGKGGHGGNWRVFAEYGEETTFGSGEDMIVAGGGGAGSFVPGNGGLPEGFKGGIGGRGSPRNPLDGQRGDGPLAGEGGRSRAEQAGPNNWQTAMGGGGGGSAGVGQYAYIIAGYSRGGRGGTNTSPGMRGSAGGGGGGGVCYSFDITTSDGFAGGDGGDGLVLIEELYD